MTVIGWEIQRLQFQTWTQTSGSPYRSCTHTHTHTHAETHMYTCTHMHLHTRMHAHVCAPARTHTYTHMHTRTRPHAHTCRHPHAHTHTHALAHTHAHTCVRTCTHAHMYTHAHTCVRCLGSQGPLPLLIARYGPGLRLEPREPALAAAPVKAVLPSVSQHSQGPRPEAGCGLHHLLLPIPGAVLLLCHSTGQAPASVTAAQVEMYKEVPLVTA